MERFKVSREVKLRETFRPVIQVKDILQAQHRDPAYRYKNVIITYKEGENRVQRYLNRGWEIVESTLPSKDDRSFTPNSKKETLRPQMRVETTTDGHDQILMRILWSINDKNILEDKKNREELRLREALRRGDKIVKRGNEVITRGSELYDGLPPLQEEL